MIRYSIYLCFYRPDAQSIYQSICRPTNQLPPFVRERAFYRLQVSRKYGVHREVSGGNGGSSVRRRLPILSIISVQCDDEPEDGVAIDVFSTGGEGIGCWRLPKLWKVHYGLYRIRFLQLIFKGSVCSIFQNLQDWHAFAPLQIKNYFCIFGIL